MNPCLQPGCPDIGVMPGARPNDDGTVTNGYWCFPHDPTVPADGPTTPTNSEPILLAEGIAAAVEDIIERQQLDVDPETMFHTDVTAGLAAMVLEIVASAMTEEDGAVEQAMVLLAGNTRLPNDVAAGIILAVTAVAAAGGIDSPAMLELAAVYEQLVEDDDENDDDDQDDEPDDLGDDDEHEDDPELVACLTCGSTFVGAANLAAHVCDGTPDVTVAPDRDKEGSAA